eukprot:879672-Pleurochrysis_carterae.AAC.1
MEVRLCRKNTILRYSATATPPRRMSRTPSTARRALLGGTCTTPKWGVIFAPTHTAPTPACHLDALAGIRLRPPTQNRAAGRPGARGWPPPRA